MVNALEVDRNELFKIDFSSWFGKSKLKIQLTQVNVPNTSLIPPYFHTLLNIF